MGLFARSSHTPEDLAHGQIVIVTFRWIMVAAGFVFALWNPEPVAELRVQILVILALAVANFYLHAQVLRRRPASLQPGVSVAPSHLAYVGHHPDWVALPRDQRMS